MDSQIIKCDVGFGMPVDPVFARKESPSHESDSGCSEMSEVRSVSPLSEVDFMSVDADDQVKLFDFDSVSAVEDTTDELENEFETYMAVPKLEDPSVRTKLKTPDPLFGGQPRLTFSEPVESQTVDADSDDPDYVRGRIIHSKALKVTSEKKPCATVITVPFVKNTQTDIHVIPSSSGAKKLDRGSNSKLAPPAVKVVKVVKTAAQSKQEIDRELIQALDDRNRKNAVQAKVNREKKKVYIKSLEDEIEELKCENFSLKESNRKAVNEKNELQEEVEYLKSVLANQSVLSGLLKNIGNVGNVKLSTSLKSKRGADLDHDYHNAGKRVKLSAKKTAGVCLHVDEGSVSLEFCSKCASMAKSDVSNS